MFQPGDKVKCVEQKGPVSYDNAKVGEVYEVSGVSIRDEYVRLVGFEPLATFTASRFVLYKPRNGLTLGWW